MRIFEKEIDNMRDLCGYKNDENKEIQSNRFVRSNVPVSLSEESIEVLMKNNITTVIDLRTSKEIERKNGIFFNNAYFDYYNFEINGGDKIPNSPEEVVDSYIDMLNGKEIIRKIFSVIAKSKGGVIYYCNAGKDRTGIVTALILKLLKVSDDVVVSDYILSGTYLENMLNEFAKASENSNILQIITPKRETLISVLNYIEKEYCGVENYLRNIGVTEEEINQIRLKAFN